MSWNKKDLLFAPLGGSGEIGMNANLYHYDGVWMMVDLGINFPDDSMPGIDVVLPDLTFLDDKTANLAGLVITHGHEDHLGAVPYFGENCAARFMEPRSLYLCCGKSLLNMASKMTFH